MKKTLVILSILLMGGISSHAQMKVKKDDKGNFVSIKKEVTEGKKTGQTFTNNKGEAFPVYESEKGKLYIIRISQKGNSYKQYLKEGE